MNTKKFRSFIIAGIILLIVTVYVITAFNGLVKKDEKVKLQWSEVQNTYQRRLDLIPNLVSVVKGVSDFEQTTLVQVTEARTRAMSMPVEITAENYQKQRVLQDTLASAANRMIILIEKYPSLKGTAAYSGLQAQLEGTERRIRVARNDFNESVANYNRAVRRFPSNIVAGIFGFKVKEGFEAEAGSDKAVEIKF
ncbi:MAG: LemA family protein [Chitinophagales bacterium]|nr:LemA family protein [Chitinophagales bacterium]